MVTSHQYPAGFVGLTASEICKSSSELGMVTSSVPVQKKVKSHYNIQACDVGLTIFSWNKISNGLHLVNDFSRVFQICS